uniref:Major facilitator superfamily (MFS) transporter n=1 Tax=mine drainage metagenome TaxID=410659 RepID=E6PYV8_9ZZZZ
MALRSFLADKSRIPGRRWRIAWLLGLGVLVNFFDRVNLSVSQASIESGFHISVVAFGYLASAYALTYALLQLPIGVILDRFGIRRVGWVSILLWSVASFASALSMGYGSLFAARLLLGVGEAPTFPANAKAIGLWFPQEERSLATALNDAAAKFASALGVPLLGALLLEVGWRWSFAATGFASLVYLAVFLTVYRDPDRDGGLSAAEQSYLSESMGRGATAKADEQPQQLGFSQLLRERKVLGLALGFGAYNYTFYLLLWWLPGYFARALGVDALHSFLFTGVPWLVATVTDLAVGGWLVDALIERGLDASRVRMTVLVVGTGCGLGLLGAAGAHTAVAAVAWVSLAIGGLSAAAPVGWSVPSLIAPRANVGAVGGIANFASQVSAIGAPIVTGYVVEATHSFAWAFVVASVYLAAGIVGYVLLLGRIEPFATVGQ